MILVDYRICSFLASFAVVYEKGTIWIAAITGGKLSV